MALSQVRKPRPNLATAYQFHREGFFEAGPYVSAEEHNIFGDAMIEELTGLVKTQFPRTDNLEHAILKSHLIIEHALTQFIRGSAHVLVEASDLRRFSFAQKVDAAYFLGLGANDPVLLPAIGELNKVRNTVAHSFELDRARVDEMLRIVSEDYEDFAMVDDRMRVRRLRGFATFVCAHLAGRLSANIWFATYLVDQERNRLRDVPASDSEPTP